MFIACSKFHNIKDLIRTRQPAFENKLSFKPDKDREEVIEIEVHKFFVNCNKLKHCFVNNSKIYQNIFILIDKADAIKATKQQFSTFYANCN